MSKRFTDSDKWEDDWFMELSDSYKLAYLYALDRCDSVGVWKPNEKLLKFFIGDINIAEFETIMNGRLVVLPCGKWWFRKFCDFQYGTLTEESTSKPIISYIKLLKKHTLWVPYTKGIHTLKEKEKEKEKEKPENAFELFWEAYPKKVGKGAAEKSWKTQKPEIVIILKAIESQKQSPQWKKEAGQFIPNPATWINQKRWEDEAVVVKTKNDFASF